MVSPLTVVAHRVIREELDLLFAATSVEWMVIGPKTVQILHLVLLEYMALHKGRDLVLLIPASSVAKLGIGRRIAPLKFQILHMVAENSQILRLAIVGHVVRLHQHTGPDNVNIEIIIFTKCEGDILHQNVFVRVKKLIFGSFDQETSSVLTIKENLMGAF